MTAFHRTVAPEDIPPEGLSLELEADAETLTTLCRRFDLRALNRLVARLQVQRSGMGIRIDGDFAADVVRTCVVTLTDFETVIAESVHILYLPDPGDADAAGVVIDPDSAEDTEPLPEAGVDPGEAVAQSLSLALDPFPRAPDASEVDPDALSAGRDDEESSPFAILEKLRNKA